MKNYTINTRELTCYSSLAEELNLANTSNCLFDLSHLGVIDLKGDKAVDFLQGQLTADIRKVNEQRMIPAAQCNLKGRILSLMDVLAWHGLKIVLPKDLLEKTLDSLSKTAMLSRVVLSPNTSIALFGYRQLSASAEDAIPGLPTDLYAQTLGENYCAYHIGNGFYIILCLCADKTATAWPFSRRIPLLGSLTWQRLSLQQGQVSIYPDTRGLFLPHRLGLHLQDYISFNKGCYKGQEIIARMHYKSTVKHALRVCQLLTNQTIHAGQKLLNPETGSEVAEIIDYSINNEEGYLAALSILQDYHGAVLLEGGSETEIPLV